MTDRISALKQADLPSSLSSVFWLTLAIAIGWGISHLSLLVASVLVAGVATIFLALINPLVGLGIALLLGPFGALENIVFGTSGLDSGQLALFLALASWIGSGLARRRLYIATSPFNLPWLLFLAVAAFSLPDARSIPMGLIELLKWVEIGLIVWLILDIAGHPDRRPESRPAVTRTVVGMLLLPGLIQAFIGIWQFGFRDTGPEHFMILDRFYRAYGTFEQPNPFGGYMNLVAFLGLGLLLGLIRGRLARRNEPDWAGIFLPARLWVLLAAIVAIAALLGVILSWSRGAWLGLLVGGAVFVLFSARRVLVGAVLLGVATIILVAGLLLGLTAEFGPARAFAARLGGFREEFTLGDMRGVDINDTNYAVVERLAHWQAAADMARDDLWTGVGFGNYEAAYSDYALINFPDALGHAHNYYLNLLAEVGLPGLIAYLVFWLAIGWQSVRLLRVLPWPERGIVVGLLAAWAALAVHHLVDKLYVNNIYVYLGVMLGLLQLLAWSNPWVNSRIGARSEPSNR